jgi:hypothetical protein
MRGILTRMNSALLVRILLGIFFLAGVFIFPYWMVITLAILVSCSIPYYFEFIAIVLIEEMLYHSTAEFGVNMLYPVGLLLIFLLIEAGRKIVRERFL